MISNDFRHYSVTDVDWRRQVATLRSAAESELQAAIGGASLCDITRRGEPAAANAKFAEGKWVALRDVERCAHLPDAMEMVEQLLLEEQRKLDDSVRANRGSDWIEYGRGRVAALSEIRDLFLTTPTQVPLELPGDGFTAGLR